MKREEEEDEGVEREGRKGEESSQNLTNPSTAQESKLENNNYFLII